MATQDKATFKSNVNALITTNGSGDISGADVNAVLTNLSDSVLHTGSKQTLSTDAVTWDVGSFDNRIASLSWTASNTLDLQNSTEKGFYRINFEKSTASDITLTLTCADVSNIYYQGNQSSLTVRGGTGINNVIYVVRFVGALYVYSPSNYAVIDDDTMATASSVTVPTSESIKAYVDATAGGEWDAVRAFVAASGTAIQNDAEADITGQTGTAGLTFLNVDILNTGRTANGAVKFINLSDDSIDVFWISEDGSVTAGGATGDPYIDVTNDAYSWVGDTDTRISRSNANEISLVTNNSTRLKIFSDGDVEHQVTNGALSGGNANSYALLNEATSATNPTVCPDRTDTDTGIGGDGANSLSLIVGGTEAVNISSGGKLAVIEQTGSQPSIHGNSDATSGVSFDNLTVKLSVSNAAKISCFTNRIEIDERFRLNEYAEFAVQAVDPSSLAGAAIVYAKDSSDGTTNATLAMQLEQSVEAIGTFTASHKLKVWINGTEYWIQLDAV